MPPFKPSGPGPVVMVADKRPRFADRLRELANSASLALMVSAGHRTGLFDTMSSLPPATSAEIAGNAALNERYVREWLAAMAAGRIVEHDPSTMTFSLPPEHAALLTRAAGAGNLAACFSLFGALAGVEDQIVECFFRGGGLPPSAYPGYDAIRAELTWARLDAAWLEETLPLVPGLPERLVAGIDVADIGCGYGHATNIMAEAYPNSRFVGWDTSEAAISAGWVEARRKQLSNVCFERRDALMLAEAEQFDFVMSLGTVHHQAWPELFLRRVVAALRPGATFLFTELWASGALPDNLAISWAPAMYAASCFHCVPVSIASGGPGPGAMWGEQEISRILSEAGFASVEVKTAPGDPFYNYYIARKRGASGARGRR